MVEIRSVASFIAIFAKILNVVYFANMDKRMIIAIVIVIVVVAVYVISRKKADPSSKAAGSSTKAAGPSLKATLSGVHRAGCDGNYVLLRKKEDGTQLYFTADVNNLAPGQATPRVVAVTDKGIMECRASVDNPGGFWSRTPSMVDGRGTLTYDKALWSK